MSDHFDAVIIGAGQAGVPLATALANKGWQTALVERKEVGGTCVNTGCTPTKTMVASARLASLVARGAEFGINVGSFSVDFPAVRERKRQRVESSRASNEKRIADAKNVELIRGEASFRDASTLLVKLNEGGDRIIRGDHIFINTGTRPVTPKITGIEQVTVLHEDTLMELDAVPQHLIIIGGGYLGLEFGQMFRRFGSTVTIVEAAKQLAGREDADVAQAVADILTEDGITILVDSQVQRVEKHGQDGIRLIVNTPDGEQHLEGSHLLLAVGRAPNSDALNLTAAGVETNERGFIRVNEYLRTNIDSIYALGDVNGGPQFTHISYDDYRIIRDNLLEDRTTSTRQRILPYVMYIDPQLGRVGLTETQARQQYRSVKVGKIPMTWVARALETNETRGFMKVVINGEDSQILGCAILGSEGGEVMSIIQMAMMGGLPYTTLRDAVYAHPTLAESLNTVLSSVE